MLKKLNLKAIFWGVVAGLISVVVTAVALIPVMALLHWLAPIMGIPDDPNDSVRALWLKNVAAWMGLITGLIDSFLPLPTSDRSGLGPIGRCFRHHTSS